MRATMRRRSSRTQMMTVLRLQRRLEGHMLPCCAAGSCGHSHRCVLPPATCFSRAAANTVWHLAGSF
jgi:hypothetical protein